MTSQFDDSMKVAWYRTPVDPEELALLMQRSDWRGWCQTLLHLGLWFGTGVTAYALYSNLEMNNWTWNLPLLLVVLFCHGTIGPFLSLIAVHELQHRTVFRTRWLNEWFERLYAFLSWSDYIWYQQSHARHHRATCQGGADGEVVLPLRFSFRRARFWMAMLAWYPPNTWARMTQFWRHASGEIRGEWYQHVLPEADEVLRREHRDWARLVLGGHLFLALVFVMSGHWFLIVVFSLGTQYCGWLGFLMGTPQHFGLNPDEADFRQNTRTFTCHWFPAFLYWNMQYHLEHHMYPAVPFYNLPKLRQLIGHDLPSATHGLAATWRELLRIRRSARNDSNYRFDPMSQSAPRSSHAG